LTLDERIRQALASDRTIDITTIGRNSGEPRRIEVWIYRVDGRVFLSGSPGTRDWYANLLANPEFRFHLKGSVQADLPARARPITDEAERRAVMPGILDDLGRGYGDLDDWVARSPLVEVEFAEAPS
jgi:deazaflavin-dependent oxidoreductase (nitroreductase family)